MIVSDKHRIIVTLPQKCATGTLQLRLSEVRDLDPYASVGPWYCDELCRVVSKHIPIKDIVRLSDFKKRKRYKRVCFVRNPYDRIYSWYLWFGYTYEKRVREGRVESARQKIDSGQDLKGVHLTFLKNTEWMRCALESAEGDFNRFLKDNPNRYSLASDFSHYKRKRWVDFLGSVETFELDFAKFCCSYGIPSVSNGNDLKTVDAKQLAERIPVNVDGHKYLKFFNDTSIGIVNKAMEADFELLGYKKF